MWLRRAALLLILVATTIIGPRAAWSGGRAPCDVPFVFEGARVNVLVLPYLHEELGRNPGGRGTWLGSAGRELSLLAQQDVLSSIVQYRSIGVINLFDTATTDCQPEWVLDRIRTKTHTGYGIAVLAGRVYEEEGGIYLQSSLRFHRREASESVTVSLPGGGRLVGRLPAQAVTFPPRRITWDDLGRIRGEFARSLVLYPEPRDDARGRALDPEAARSYWVTDTRGEWMKIELPGAEPGWIHARPGRGDWPLRSKLPELHYVDAVVGYLQARIALDAHEAPPPLAWMQQSLDRYAEQAGAGAGAAPVALGKVMQGTLEILEAREGEDRTRALAHASELFTAAVALTPEDPDTRNLEALARMARCCSAESPRKAADDLSQALALDPGNKDALSNLEAYYGFLRGRPEGQNAFGAERELEERLEGVREVRKSLGAATP